MMLAGLKKFADNAHLFFIPVSYRSDDVVFRKCKIFINTTLLTSVFALFFLGNAILFEMPMATRSMIVCAVLFFSFAWMLKLGVPFKVCTNLYIALGVSATAWDAYWAGGLHSIHTPWFVFPAIGAILIGSVRQGVFWMIVSALVVLAFGAATFAGYRFPPNELGPDYIDAMGLSALLGLIVILFLVVHVVESAYQAGLKKLEAALHSLRKSQQQLVHQEKLASLGKMSAGIAHEIQNPLNFVNNFASVSKELLDELKEAQSEEDREQIVKLLTENLSRIEQHGRRAESIVKDMLMHSSRTPGEKQLSDITRICDEALSLACQSAKAGIPDFEFSIDKKYSPAQVLVIPQEISRVVLNLLNNSIYSVNQKSKFIGAAYRPSISVSTQVSGSAVLITVRDNGMGISPEHMNDIFQPFFTTKPTREGTGLGLSISYDIVKAHGGEIKAESSEKENATFTVSLPLVV